MLNTKRILVLASVFALCACSDRPAPAPTAPAASPAAPARTELTGTVVLSNTDLAPVYLKTQDGLIALEGSAALTMSNVLGADVEVRGAWDANTAFVVETFLVVAVKGLPALDGWVEQMDDGLALRLSDGSHHKLIAAPDALAAYIGARVWVTESADASTIDFGVIQDNR